MRNSNVIEFYEARDFSKRMTVTFEFIRQNFKGLGKSLVLIAGPTVLLGGILFGDFFSGTMQSAIGAGENPEQFQNLFTSGIFFAKIGLGAISILISYILLISVVNNYFLIYKAKKSSAIKVQEVWDAVRATFFKYLVSTLLISVLLVIVYVIMIIPGVLLATISSGLNFLFILIAVVGIIFISIRISLVFIVQGFEDKNAFESLSRSFYLTKGKFWSTFATIMLLSIMGSIISYIFTVPFSIVFYVLALNNSGGDISWMPTLVGLMYGVMIVVSSLAQLLPLIGGMFQYFNLVELKESKGLMADLETIGATVTTTSTENPETY